jgi:AraC-like DNA-binding protein
MSVSGFHAHFRAVTAMSPLRFQKQLRLQEAPRLMLSEDLDAAGAGYRVGYDDASHFSREYKRHFGEPPMRDIVHIREIETSHDDAERVIERFGDPDRLLSVRVSLVEYAAFGEDARQDGPGIYGGKRREAEPLTGPLVV